MNVTIDKSEMNGNELKKGVISNNNGLRRNKTKKIIDDEDFYAESDALVRNQQNGNNLQQRLEREQLERMQDDHLDAIEQSLARVGEMAKGFTTELQIQNNMLDGIGVEIEATNTSMKKLEDRTAKLIDSAGGPRWCLLITCLSCIALFLFLMIIYT